jgi:hypothetical protein
MDTITILGISLLFFYSLTTILQFYGIDTSVYAIYVLFYIFIIISRLILPTTYMKLFPSDTTPTPAASDFSAPTPAASDFSAPSDSTPIPTPTPAL